MNHNTRAFLRETTRPPAAQVFPELLPPEDTGRSYPIWPDRDQSSIWPRIFSHLSAIARRIRLAGTVPTTAAASHQRRNQPERGSGSWGPEGR